MKLMIQRTMIFPAVLGLLAACGAAAEVERTETEVEETPVDSHEQSVVQDDTPPPQKTTPPKPKVEIVAAARTPLEGKKAPKLRFVQPRKDSVAKRDIMVKFDLKNWKVGPAPGKHVHLFVDDHPYIAIRDVAKPINLNKLVKEKLGVELAEGSHILRAFPSRATHESVKEGTPFAQVVVHYKNKTEGFTYEPKSPVLTYSRPKGCVVAGQPTLLDFYVANIGGDFKETGHTVNVLVDNEKVATITDWTPHQLSGLAAGDHTVELMLVNSGEPVKTLLEAKQTISVKAACEEPKPAADKAEAKADKKAAKAEAKAAKAEAKAEAKADKAEAKAEAKAGKSEAKADKKADKANK